MDKINTVARPLRVLYLFAGERAKTEGEWKAGRMPDSFLVGLNHLSTFGIDAFYIENGYINYIRKKNFNLTNLFLLPILHRYDIVFSGASLSLPFVAKVIFRLKKPKFVWYNTFFTNALKRNVGSRFKLWAFRKTIASLDAIVCPSTAQRDFLISQGFDSQKIFYVPNGIDIDFMRRKLAEENTEKTIEPFILSVGKDMGRDYKTLAEAVEGLSVKVKVVALPRNFTSVKKIPTNVEIMGFVPFDRLVELYKKALFVVIPTKSENHLDASDCSGQYVLLDAMSIGKAIIASERGTLADYFTNGKEGVVVPTEDSLALKKAIEVMLADDAQRHRLGKQAEIRGATFTTRRLSENLAKVFRQVMEK